MFASYRVQVKGMTSPGRQMNSRRLPPLPGGSKRGGSPQQKQTSPTTKPPFRPDKAHYDMVVTGE